jgi:hypothetical protein
MNRGFFVQQGVYTGENPMLDVIAALTVSAVLVIFLITLIGTARFSPAVRACAYGIAAGWVVLMIGITALGGFAPGAIGRVPGPILGFGILMIGGLAAWFSWPAFRDTLLALPLSALIGINVFRIAGVFFLILFAQDRLSAPFAQSAALGDIITGLVAIPLAAMIAAGTSPPRPLIAAWNAFGTLDLVAALTLAALSTPGTPFRLFTEEPGNVVMATLPWILIPTTLVPLWLLVHLTIASRLRSAPAPRPLALAT